MTEEQNSKVARVEMEITLPTIMEDPIKRQDGTVLAVGDLVE